MKIGRYVFLLFFFFTITMVSQEEEKIEWEENRPLTWNDFKAEPEESVDYEANTNSGISFSWKYSTETGRPILEYEVVTKFHPNRSWVKEVEESEYLLGHEQLHFDISELHARKLRKAIDEYELGRNIRRDLNRLYEKIEKQRSKMQNQFDAETRHSTNKEAEMHWREFVARELEKLKDYQE